MEITTTTINRRPGRRAAVNALAFVGFIALIVIGIMLAIYIANNTPKIGSKFGGAAVSLSSIFHRDDNPSLQVVTATSTLPFGDDSVTATSSLPAGASAATSTGSTGSKGSSASGSAGTVTKYVTVTTTTTVQPHGDPDLKVTITQTGYLRTKGDTSTFVGSDSIPSGKDGAVKFTVANVGTNVTGNWKFTTETPYNSSDQDFTSPTQDSLNPGDSADFVLGFTRTSRKDNDRLITVDVDPTHNVTESDESNNEATATVDLD